MKFSNLNPTPLFGHYTDPFAQRRGSGPVRPPVPLKQAAPDFLRERSPEGLFFAWLGHSSVFLRMANQNILIDPVFCRYTSPLPFLGPKRFDGAVPRPSDFPSLDWILITHSHYDHLDKSTVLALNGQTKHFLVPAGVGSILIRFGIPAKKITELGWYESSSSCGLTITAIPTQHSSARSPFDQNQTLWCGFILKDGRHTVLDTGDGGFGAHWEEIHNRYRDVDLMIAECGQYNVRWHGLHMFPEESAEAARIFHAGLAVPVHWGAYVLSDHAWDDPPKRFARAAEEKGVRYLIPKLNQVLDIDSYV